MIRYDLRDTIMIERALFPMGRVPVFGFANITGYRMEMKTGACDDTDSRGRNYRVLR